MHFMKTYDPKPHKRFRVAWKYEALDFAFLYKTSYNLSQVWRRTLEAKKPASLQTSIWTGLS